MVTHNFHINLSESPDKMKEHELCDEYITEVVHLAPKAYIFPTTNKQQGTQKYVVHISKKKALIYSSHTIKQALKIFKRYLQPKHI